VGALAVTLAYLAGCVPTGLLLARRVGVDIRRVGSGNIGATNVSRAAGIRLGLLTLLGDALKGALPTAAAGMLGGSDALVAAVAVATVVGHVFPITLGLRGGKGVATALGTLVVSAPYVAAAAVGLFALALAITRRVSVGSLAAAIAVPFLLVFGGAGRPLVVAMAVVASLILVRHRENIGRLIDGTEPRIGRA
jgi:glycerol-3-phosphate acyltransferase PlsY